MHVTQDSQSRFSSCRQYALLEMSDEEADTSVEPPPAPTTSVLPKKKEKHIRRKPEAAAVEAGPEAEEPLQLGRRRKRDWEEDEGGCQCLPCIDVLHGVSRRPAHTCRETTPSRRAAGVRSCGVCHALDGSWWQWTCGATVWSV